MIKLASMTRSFFFEAILQISQYKIIKEKSENWKITDPRLPMMSVALNDTVSGFL